MLRKTGGYLNIAEDAAAQTMKTLGIEYQRRGYPDFMVMKDGDINGFIEVKPNAGKDLRIGQQAFKRMCERFGIPFIRWCPEDGPELIRSTFLA